MSFEKLPNMSADFALFDWFRHSHFATQIAFELRNSPDLFDGGRHLAAFISYLPPFGLSQKGCELDDILFAANILVHPEKRDENENMPKVVPLSRFREIE